MYVLFWCLYTTKLLELRPTSEMCRSVVRLLCEIDRLPLILPLCNFKTICGIRALYVGITFAAAEILCFTIYAIVFVMINNKEMSDVTEAERLVWLRKAAGTALFTYKEATLFTELVLRVIADTILIYALTTYHNVLLRVCVKIMTVLLVFQISDLAVIISYFVITSDLIVFLIDFCVLVDRLIIYITVMSLVNAEWNALERTSTRSRQHKLSWNPVHRSTSGRSKSSTPSIGRNSLVARKLLSPMRYTRDKGSPTGEQFARGKSGKVKFKLPTVSDEDDQNLHEPSNRTITSTSSILRGSDKQSTSNKDPPKDVPKTELKKPPMPHLLEWKPFARYKRDSTGSPSPPPAELPVGNKGEQKISDEAQPKTVEKPTKFMDKILRSRQKVQTTTISEELPPGEGPKTAETVTRTESPPRRKSLKSKSFFPAKLDDVGTTAKSQSDTKENKTLPAKTQDMENALGKPDKLPNTDSKLGDSLAPNQKFDTIKTDELPKKQLKSDLKVEPDSPTTKQKLEPTKTEETAKSGKPPKLEQKQDEIKTDEQWKGKPPKSALKDEGDSKIAQHKSEPVKSEEFTKANPPTTDLKIDDLSTKRQKFDVIKTDEPPKAKRPKTDIRDEYSSTTVKQKPDAMRSEEYAKSKPPKLDPNTDETSKKITQDQIKSDSMKINDPTKVKQLKSDMIDENKESSVKQKSDQIGGEESAKVKPPKPDSKIDEATTKVRKLDTIKINEPSKAKPRKSEMIDENKDSSVKPKSGETEVEESAKGKLPKPEVKIDEPVTRKPKLDSIKTDEPPKVRTDMKEDNYAQTAKQKSHQIRTDESTKARPPRQDSKIDESSTTKPKSDTIKIEDFSKSKQLQSGIVKKDEDLLTMKQKAEPMKMEESSKAKFLKLDSKIDDQIGKERKSDLVKTDDVPRAKPLILDTVEPTTKQKSEPMKLEEFPKAKPPKSDSKIDDPSTKTRKSDVLKTDESSKLNKSDISKEEDSTVAKLKSEPVKTEETPKTKTPRADPKTEDPTTKKQKSDVVKSEDFAKPVNSDPKNTEELLKPKPLKSDSKAEDTTTKKLKSDIVKTEDLAKPKTNSDLKKTEEFQKAKPAKSDSKTDPLTNNLRSNSIKTDEHPKAKPATSDSIDDTGAKSKSHPGVQDTLPSTSKPKSRPTPPPDKTRDSSRSPRGSTSKEGKRKSPFRDKK